jgi:hypothetical protein
MSGSNGGDRYGTGMAALINRSGIDTSADTNDPSVWVSAGSDYKDEWMPWYFKDGDNQPTTGLNGKIAWASFDFGASTSLDTLYLFNSNYQGGNTGINAFNLYYADSPSVPLPTEPAINAFSSTGATLAGDYDFSSGGWSLLNTSGTFTATKAGNTSVDLGGITARYVAIEAITNYGDTHLGGRSGMDEVVFVSVPEPSSSMLMLLGIGGLPAMLWRAAGGSGGRSRPIHRWESPRPRRGCHRG